MTTLVTGGSGFVGAHVTRALLQRGERVRCLVREDDPHTLRGLEVERVLGDLRDRESLRQAVRGCSSVYHCAADYRLFAGRPREIYETNVGGTRRLLEESRTAGVEDVVVTSSVGALATSRDGAPADEETPVALEQMVGHYKRSKFLAEAEAMRAFESGQRVFLVHPSTPVGELDVKPTPTGQILVDFLCGRMPAVVDTALNFVDVRDVAAGHLLAASRGEPGRRYILGAHNLTLRRFLDLVADVSGRRPVRLRIPHALPLVAGVLSTGLSRIFGGTPRVPLEGVRMARHRMTFDSSRAVRELGLPQSPLVDAVRRAVVDFVRRGVVSADRVRSGLLEEAPS